MIQKKRIRNLDLYVASGFKDQLLKVIVRINDPIVDEVRKIGFPENFKDGDAILPRIVGPVSSFNAEGKNKIRRDLPLETAYRQIEWTWNEFHGPNQVEKHGIRDVPYKRYPREKIPPPSIELQILSSENDQEKIIATPSIKFDDRNKTILLHAINLCLEIFGHCELVKEDLTSAFKTKMTRLNWQVLPEGKHPWENLLSRLQPVLNQAKKGKKGILEWRFETVNKLSPEFVAVGRGGFSGYVVFGFPKRDLYIVESAFYGNATYIFEKNWEQLSQMTKAEILNDNLQKDRLVHHGDWSKRIKEIM